MPQALILFFPLAAVWITLMGALVNGDRRPVTVSLAVGVVAGVAAIVLSQPWLLVVVVGCWAGGLGLMVRDHRADGRR